MSSAMYDDDDDDDGPGFTFEGIAGEQVTPAPANEAVFELPATPVVAAPAAQEPDTTGAQIESQEFAAGDGDTDEPVVIAAQLPVVDQVMAFGSANSFDFAFVEGGGSSNTVALEDDKPQQHPDRPLTSAGLRPSMLTPEDAGAERSEVLAARPIARPEVRRMSQSEEMHYVGPTPVSPDIVNQLISGEYSTALVEPVRVHKPVGHRPMPHKSPYLAAPAVLPVSSSGVAAALLSRPVTGSRARQLKPVTQPTTSHPPPRQPSPLPDKDANIQLPSILNHQPPHRLVSREEGRPESSGVRPTTQSIYLAPAAAGRRGSHVSTKSGGSVGSAEAATARDKSSPRRREPAPVLPATKESSLRAPTPPLAVVPALAPMEPRVSPRILDSTPVIRHGILHPHSVVTAPQVAPLVPTKPPQRPSPRMQHATLRPIA